MDYDELYFKISNIIGEHFDCNIVEATDCAKDITQLIEQHVKIQTGSENEDYQEEESS